MTKKASRPELEAELGVLRARLAEAEEALRAIRTGTVDAVLVTGERGEHVYTLSGADRAYRQVIETMSEGAVTLSADGVILYCNKCFAQLLARPLDQVMGSALRDYLPPADQRALAEILGRTGTEPSRREVTLLSGEDRAVPVYLSASRLRSEGAEAETVFGLVLTDLTQQKSLERVVAAERLARSILEQAAEAIVVCDAQGRVIRASQAAQRLCDGNPLERSFDEAFPLRAATAGPFLLAPVLHGETLHDVDVALGGDGRELDLILNAGPLLSGTEILGCVVTLTDITERRRAEAALRASLQEFRTLAESMPQIVWITRPDGWNVFFNQRWVEYTGLTLEESAGHGWNTPFHPDDQQRAWDAWQKATTENAVYSLEARLRRADGVYRWWLVRGVPLLDAAGAIVKWYGTCTDIHDLKMAEQRIVQANQALLESERRFSDLLDSVELVAFMLDQEGLIAYCNEQLLRLTGWQREDVIGRNWFEMFVPPDLGDLQGRFFAALLADEAGAHHLENDILTRTGERRLIRFNNMVLRSPTGDAIGVASIGEDITEQKRAQEALLASEAFYRSLFENISDGIFVVDVTPDQRFRLVSFNPAEERSVGMTTAQVAGRFTDDILPRDVAEQVNGNYRRCAAERRITRYEEVLDLPRGKMAFHTTLMPLAAPDGRIHRIIGVARDITDRRRSEDAAARASHRNQLLLRNASDGVHILDADGSVLEVSDSFCEMLGYSREELLGANVSLWDAQWSPQQLRQNIARQIAAGGRSTFVTRQRRRDGSVFDVEVTGQPLELEGRPVLFNSARDITERRKAEGRLRLQGAALDAAANAIVITGLDGTIEWANAAFTTLTGYSAEEAVGKNPRDLVKSGTHDRAFYQHMWDTILAGHVWQGELTNRRKDGSVYSEEMTVTPVKDERGALAHFVAIKRDLTEHHELEGRLRQSQKMETVGQLAGGIAHDFNNLLTVMITTADLALGTLREGDPLCEDFQEVRRAAERAAGLTRQLLAFSRKQLLQPEVVSLNALVRGMEKMLRRVIRESIALRVVPTHDVESVRADPGQLEQVLMNLAVNARDAMPDGGTLTIETAVVELDEASSAEHPSMQPGSYVMLAVGDTGVGMDEATRQRIFEPFFTTKEIGKGSGLGLSTVYGIVKQSGGYIWVYSEPGLGTTFKIYLPRQDAVAQSTQPAATIVSVRGTETILIVEDDAALRHMAGRLLRLSGYTVLTADNGTEALALLKGHDGPVPLVLTDMIMPGMGGRELATALKALRPETKVIFTSGYTDDALLHEGRFDAASHFIGKPYTAVQLRTKVREVLDS